MQKLSYRTRRTYPSPQAWLGTWELFYQWKGYPGYGKGRVWSKPGYVLICSSRRITSVQKSL